MAEWLYEAGIGENRAALIADGRIRRAEIEVEKSGVRVGAVTAARLIDRADGLIRLASGEEAWCAPWPSGVSEGATVLVRIVREAIAETGRAKLAKAMPAPDAAPSAGPTLLERITASGVSVRRCHPHEPDLLEQSGWSELLEEAMTGDIAFPGGALLMALTPAMTLFDVDGPPPLDRLALAAAQAVAETLEQMQITGSIGIDFPTLAGKAERQAVGEAIDAALPRPFERTGMNGFGFLQIVRRRERASLPEILRHDLAGAMVRAELRRLERLPPPAPAIHRVSAAMAQCLAHAPHWLEELHRRTGGATEVVADGV